MKKQFFTLLTFLVVCVTGAWGADYVLSASSCESSTTFTVGGQTFTLSPAHGGTGQTGYGEYIKFSKGKTYTITLPTGFSLTNINIKGYTNSNGKTDGEIASIGGVSQSSKTFPAKDDANLASQTQITTGYDFAISQTGGTVVIVAKNTSQICVLITITGTPAPTTPSLVGAWSKTSDTYYKGDATPVVPTFSVTASNEDDLDGSEYTVTFESSDDDVASVTSAGVVTLKNTKSGSANITATVTSTNEEDYLTPDPNEFVYTVTVNEKVPTITLNKTSVTLKSTPVTRTASTTVTLTGAFLDDGNYSVSTIASGLGISPTSFTVAEGEVSQEFTITYNPGDVAVAANSENISFSDGTTSVDLIVNYSSIVAHEWATVSTATTWDWTKLTGANNELTGSTAPKNTDEFLLGDMDGEVLAQNIGYNSATFNACALKVVCQYAVRDKKYLQGNSIKLKTSVPGKLTVVFSNTGGSRPYRHLTINGDLTEFKSNASTEKDVTASELYVPAGEITIAGYIPDQDDAAARKDKEGAYVDVVGPTMLRIYSITFTPLAEVPTTVGSTITACGYNTFSSIYPLDLSTLTSGMKAYVVSEISGNMAVLTESTAKVPARTGLIIKGTASEDFTIETTSDATSAPANNLLVGVPNGLTLAKAAGSYNNYVFGWEDAANPAFYLIDGTNATLPAGKAYLHTSSTLTSGASAPSIFRIVESENNATSIESIEQAEKAVKFVENGRILIKKNGIVYDALGRIVK